MNTSGIAIKRRQDEEDGLACHPGEQTCLVFDDGETTSVCVDVRLFYHSTRTFAHVQVLNRLKARYIHAAGARAKVLAETALPCSEKMRPRCHVSAYTSYISAQSHNFT